MSDTNLTDSELALLKRYVVRNRDLGDSTSTGGWAARCQDLILELERLQLRAAHLSENTDRAGTAHRKLSDTAIL